MFGILNCLQSIPLPTHSLSPSPSPAPPPLFLRRRQCLSLLFILSLPSLSPAPQIKPLLIQTFVFFLRVAHLFLET
ncbi:hypothetical protein LguiA_014179 [Lonicera macranthoides]